MSIKCILLQKKRTETNQNELTLSQIRNNCAKLPINMCKLQKHTCHPDLFDALDLFAPRPDQKATKNKATHLRVWPQAQVEPFIVFFLRAITDGAEKEGKAFWIFWRDIRIRRHFCSLWRASRTTNRWVGVLATEGWRPQAELWENWEKTIGTVYESLPTKVALLHWQINS